MKTDLLAIVGAEGREADAVRTAMHRVFPGAAAVFCSSLGAALAVPESAGAEVLALLTPTQADVAAAVSARNRAQLPRWAVIACGGGNGLGSELSASLWEADVLAAILPAIWARQAAVRESEQFRGDLKAIGTRVAHDLRSPLGGILSTSEIMGEVLREVAPHEAERTKRIIESEEEMLHLVRTLSTLTTAFATPVAVEAFDMAIPVGVALQRLEPKMIIRGDQVARPASWPTVWGDERKCELIWTQMLQNVIDHTAVGRKVSLEWSVAGDFARFSVIDDGAGVPVEKRALLFWPFHRQHEPQAAKGFGLPLVERLVRMQGGWCEFSPANDGGSAFSFLLPART